jgi:N-methylhydantoinase A
VSTDQVFVRSRSAYVRLDADAVDQMNEVFSEMERDRLEALDIVATDATITRTFDGRLVGQTWDTPFVPVPNGTLASDDVTAMIESFHRAYEARWGNRFVAHDVEGVTYRVQVVVPTEKVAYPTRASATGEPPVVGTAELRHLGDRPVTTRLYDRAALGHGHRISGPALVREQMTTTHVGTGQIAEVGRYGELIITVRGGD